jgi:hypothetical protein
MLLRLKTNLGHGRIGINLSYTGLKPVRKDKFVALVDFLQPGDEMVRKDQLDVLRELGIETIILNGEYTTQEIRDIYKKVSVLFLQSYEAFGLPIAECLSCGVQIFASNSAWPMAWRLNDNPEIHKEGTLAEVFNIYSSKDDLKNQLYSFRESYNLINSPFTIFNTFIKNYPHYYYGRINVLRSVLERINDENLSHGQNPYDYSI